MSGFTGMDPDDLDYVWAPGDDGDDLTTRCYLAMVFIVAMVVMMVVLWKMAQTGVPDAAAHDGAGGDPAQVGRVEVDP